MSGPIKDQQVARQASSASSVRHGRNAAAIGTAYHVHFQKLVSDLTAAFGPGPPDPEDVAQRVFEQLIKRGNIQDIASLEAFLWRAAKNHRLSLLRSMASADRRDTALEVLFLGSPGYLENPQRVLESKERMALTLRALEAMPPDRRKAFQMVRFDGLAHKDVAQAMGISRPAVSRHVAKAMRDIARALEEAGSDLGI